MGCLGVGGVCGVCERGCGVCGVWGWAGCVSVGATRGQAPRNIR